MIALVRNMAESNLKTTEIGVKMDPQLMAEVDLWARIYGNLGKMWKTSINQRLIVG